MIKIIHRVNEIEKLLNLDQGYGVEIDLHAFGERLVVNHDAFQDGPNFSTWLKSCRNRFVIFNIKEEGIENRVIGMALENGVEDFFLLDLSFPALVKMIHNGEKRLAIRVSEYESIENALCFTKKIDWVWLDCFEGFPLNVKDFNLLKGAGFKICLVSPELHGPHRTTNEIVDMQEFIKIQDLTVDAVCTKYPEIW